MPTRAEILDTLAASQTLVLAFFHGLSPDDLERPATASEVPGSGSVARQGSFCHLMQNERNIEQLLRRSLAGEPRDVFLRSQYHDGMPVPGVLGDCAALTTQEQEQLERAVAQINQTTVNSHHDDSMEDAHCGVPGGATGTIGPAAPVH